MSRAPQRPQGRRQVYSSPVRDALLRILVTDDHGHGLGLTTIELAERLGRDVERTGAMLCKLHMYGTVEKISERRDGRYAHEVNRWRLP